MAMDQHLFDAFPIYGIQEYTVDLIKLKVYIQNILVF